MKNIFTATICALLLLGCSAKEKVIQIKEYMPSYVSKQSATAKKSGDKVVKIKTTTTHKNYLDNDMWYKKELESSSYAYSRWVLPPNILVSRALESGIEDSAAFRSVISPSFEANGDFIVESALVDFYQDFVSDISEAVMVVKVSLVSNNGGKIIASKKFEYRQRCKSNDANGGVQSFADILGRFSFDVGVWIKSVL